LRKQHFNFFLVKNFYQGIIGITGPPRIEPGHIELNADQNSK
jgi:hypothetical protein